MKIKTEVISKLEKCYSIAPLFYKGKNHFLVAAEKVGRCLLFDPDGNLVDTIWTEPGGTMSMVQVPDSDGEFLATHKFYSPNDSKEARIVIVTPVEEGKWQVRTLAEVPFAHRFDIIERNNKKFLIVCALKSGHEYKDDWSMPGKVYAAELPLDLSAYNEEHQLELKVIKDGMLKNHGYSKYRDEECEKALISCNEGIFLFTPPKPGQEEWNVECLLEEPVSDAVLLDLDQDGECELCTLSPFHGDKIAIYKNEDGRYKEVYVYPETAEFSHAIWGAPLCGKPAFITGYRQGKKKLMAISYDEEQQIYRDTLIDEGRGPANVFHYINNGVDVVIAANRESDEITMYQISEYMV